MADILSDFVAFCHMIHEHGLVAGSGGNISMRSEKGIFISPAGRALGSLSEDDVSLMDLQGQPLSGPRPSSEFRLHAGCYAARPEVNVVVHVHSVYAVAVSCLQDTDHAKSMPLYTPGYGKRVGSLPMIPYYTPGSEQLAEAVRHHISSRNSVLLQNHGLVTVGKNREAALGLAEEIEENAKITLLLGDRGRELSPAQLEALAGYV